ncbi:hypothetical protein D3C75_1141890 [compost metagenome]
MSADRLGVFDQPRQLLIHFLGDTGFQHAHLQLESTRHSFRHALPPLANLNQVAERLDHPAQRTDGAFMRMHVERRTNHRALDCLRPGFVPAIHRPGPGQLVQQVRRTGIGVVQGA